MGGNPEHSFLQDILKKVPEFDPEEEEKKLKR